jgi:hypothetical protein
MPLQKQNPARARTGVCEVHSDRADQDASQSTIADTDAQYQLIAKIRKNSREEFRVAIRDFTGFRGVELRVWQKNGQGTFVETPRAIAVRHDVLPAIIDALQAALATGGAA